MGERVYACRCSGCRRAYVLAAHASVHQPEPCKNGIKRDRGRALGLDV
jgi:hypothetical protein